MVEVVLAILVVLLLLLVGAWAVAKPYAALLGLLVGLVFHSGVAAVLRNVVGIDDRLFVLISSWKEVLIVGLLVAAVARFRRAPFRVHLADAAVLAFLGLVFLRGGLDLVSGASTVDELQGARDASEFAFVFLIVRALSLMPSG